VKTRGRTDANQTEIVRVLRSMGASVTSLASVGAGCPDLLVGFCGRTILLEVKDGEKPPSARALTPAEKQWHEEWRGKRVVVVNNTTEAVMAVAKEGK